jgi:hypothetical protein
MFSVTPFLRKLVTLQAVCLTSQLLHNRKVCALVTEAEVQCSLLLKPILETDLLRGVLEYLYSIQFI